MVLDPAHFFDAEPVRCRAEGIETVGVEEAVVVDQLAEGEERGGGGINGGEAEVERLDAVPGALGGPRAAIGSWMVAQGLEGFGLAETRPGRFEEGARVGVGTLHQELMVVRRAAKKRIMDRASRFVLCKRKRPQRELRSLQASVDKAAVVRRTDAARRPERPSQCR